MTIAFDTSSQGTAGANPSWSHTCTGTDRLLIVIVGSSTDTNSAVTYDGVAMTQVTATTYPGSGHGGLKMWRLANPASGSNTIAVTSSNAGTGGMALSYTGVDQTTPIDSSNVNNNASGTSSLTVTTTVVGSNCWLVGGSSNNDGGTVSGGSGTTVRQFTGQGYAEGDSNGTVSTGSQSLIFTMPGNNLFKGIIASIAPVAASGPANLKTYNTNLKANIKSIDTNLIANVKTLNTNA